MIVVVSKRFRSREIVVDIGVVFGDGFAMRLHRHNSVWGAGTMLLRRVSFGVNTDEIEVGSVDFGE